MRPNIDIGENIHSFLRSNDASTAPLAQERAASFDYCYNYFQGFRDRRNTQALASADHLQVSCLQIAFYLASWGMLRASSLLLNKSLAHYIPLIELLASTPEDIWAIDIPQYGAETIEELLSYERKIAACIGDPHRDRKATSTLTTKILLGVMGNVPAFDNYFCKGFGVWTFNRQALEKIGQFYRQHQTTIDAHRIYTIDFGSEAPTSRLYPRAKMMDMIFFNEGMKG